MLKFIVTCYYGKQSIEEFFRGIFTSNGTTISYPQPTAPTENIGYEIPSGMIEQLLANPYAGDGTEHPDMHLIYVEQICGLLKLAGLPRDEVMKKVFPLSLKGKELAWYRLWDDIGSWNWNRLKLEFHQKNYHVHLVHCDRNYQYNFWPREGESIALAWGGLSQRYIHAPIMRSQEKLLSRNFMLGFLVMIKPCLILLVLVPL